MYFELRSEHRLSFMGLGNQNFEGSNNFPSAHCLVLFSLKSILSLEMTEVLRDRFKNGSPASQFDNNTAKQINGEFRFEKRDTIPNSDEEMSTEEQNKAFSK